MLTYTNLQEIGFLQFRYIYPTRPAPIHRVEYSRNNCVYISGMKLSGLFEERQARMCIDHVLHERRQVLRQYVLAKTLTAW